MQTLGAKFRMKGCFFDLAKRENVVAIFALQYVEDGPVIGYDTVVIQVASAGEIMGKQYPERERMPYSEEYGRYAWSFNRLKAAEKKFAELTGAKNAG
jgi:hypothetical protein